MNDNSAARWINIAVGVWLFISAFIWPHTEAQMTNTWIVGLLCAIFAAAALRVPEARYLNVALAIWLFISVWALPMYNDATFWNNLIFSVVMFVVALIPNVMRGRTTPTDTPGRRRTGAV